MRSGDPGKPKPRRMVAPAVRHGYGPARNTATDIGPIEAARHKVRTDARAACRLYQLHIGDFASPSPTDQEPRSLVAHLLAARCVDRRFQEALSALLQRMRRSFRLCDFGPERPVAGRIRAPAEQYRQRSPRDPELVRAARRRPCRISMAPRRAVAGYALDYLCRGSTNMCVTLITGQGSPI